MEISFYIKTTSTKKREYSELNEKIFGDSPASKTSFDSNSY
jgi:hypothetical protein